MFLRKTPSYFVSPKSIVHTFSIPLLINTNYFLSLRTMATSNIPPNNTTTHLEIERKFVLLPGIEDRILKDITSTSTPPTSNNNNNTTIQSKHSLLDIYYDTPFPDIRLCRQDAWLRRRNTDWELKWPSVSLQERLKKQKTNETSTNETKPSPPTSSVVDHYIEYTDLQIIASKLQCSKSFLTPTEEQYKQYLSTSSSSSSLSTPITYPMYIANEFENFLIKEEGFTILLRVQTNRRTYNLPLSILSTISSNYSMHNSLLTSSSSSSPSSSRISSLHIDIDEVIYPDQHNSTYSLAEIEVMIESTNTSTSEINQYQKEQEQQLSTYAEDIIHQVSNYYGFKNPSGTPLGKVLEYIRRYQSPIYQEMINIGLVDLKTG